MAQGHTGNRDVRGPWFPKAPGDKNPGALTRVNYHSTPIFLHSVQAVNRHGEATVQDSGTFSAGSNKQTLRGSNAGQSMDRFPALAGGFGRGRL